MSIIENLPTTKNKGAEKKGKKEEISDDAGIRKT